MANKQLTAKVRLNTTQAEQKLKNIAKAIDAINRAAGKQSNAYNQVNSALGKTVKTSEKVRSKTDQTTQSTKKWSNAVGDVNKKLNSSSKSISLIGSKLRGLADQYLGVMGMGAVVKTSDMITSAENKLNYVSSQQLGDSGTNADGTYSTATFKATQDAMDKMYASSQKVRMGYGDMMSNVSKSMALAGDAFNNNTDMAIRFQEVMAEAYAVGGASAQEMSSSMYQLIQALGSGTLAGDELRSVREGAPLAYKAIEEFAQKVYDTTDSLKDMGSQGMITSDIVTAAILESGEAMDKAFAQTEQTFSQTWTQIKNVAIRAFKPISEMLRKSLNNAIDSGLIQKIETAFSNIAKGIMIAFTVVSNVLRWIGENWSWLQHIVVGAITLMITYLLIKMGIAVYCAYQEAKAWLIANAAMLSTLAIIGTIIFAVIMLIYVFYLWKTAAIDTCQAIVAALLIVGVAILLIGILTGNVATIVIGIVIAAIGLIINWLDYFLAVLYSIVSVIWNLIVTLVFLIIKSAIVPLTTAWDNFANFFGNLFNDPIAAIIRAFQSLASSVLSILQTIANGIDAIFGTNLASTVQGWVSGLSSKADELVERYGNGTYDGSSDAASQVYELLDSIQTTISWDTSDAWNTGKSHGAAAQDWLNNFGSQFQGSGSGSRLLDSLGEKLGLDFSGLTFPTDGVGDLSSDPSKALDNIDDNTGKMADAMELTSEDVEYLRKIAAMEWKKEYTVADIKVDMSNYNTISGDNDLDGIVTKLVDKLYEELNEVADGVYAY